MEHATAVGWPKTRSRATDVRTKPRGVFHNQSARRGYPQYVNDLGVSRHRTACPRCRTACPSTPEYAPARSGRKRPPASRLRSPSDGISDALHCFAWTAILAQLRKRLKSTQAGGPSAPQAATLCLGELPQPRRAQLHPAPAPQQPPVPTRRCRPLPHCRATGRCRGRRRVLAEADHAHGELRGQQLVGRRHARAARPPAHRLTPVAMPLAPEHLHYHPLGRAGPGTGTRIRSANTSRRRPWRAGSATWR